MFSINRETHLTIEILQKMINKFYVSVLPKLQKNKNYYDGKQDILNKSYTDSTKPCSRIVTNYCRNIADSYCGYLAAPGYISYTSDNDIEAIMNVLKYNDYQSEDADFLLSALTFGVANELMYLDENSQVRFKIIDARTCFGIFDNSLTNDLLYFVRMYKADEWDESDNYKVDVYSDNTITHYNMTGQNGNLIFASEENHYFSQCPANIFYLQDEKAIFECIESLQDAVNELLSCEVDDYSAFCDAYLTLTGVDAEAEDIAQMKENRVLVLPEGASAAWLTKSSNDTQVENILKRMHDSIYRIAQCPDFSAESFIGGVSSGIAIRYRLTGMETRAAKICAEMKKALQRRIEIICGIATLKLGDEIFRDIQIDFTRNIPEDSASVVDMITKLKGTVSDATLIAQLPFITDVNAELDRINQQQQENMAMYAFTGASEDEAE